MVADGGRDAGVFTLSEREVAADRALQLGKLAHHAGEQVGLGQLRGPFGIQCGLLPGIRHVEQCGMPCSPEPCFHRQTPAAGARYLEA